MRFIAPAALAALAAIASPLAAQDAQAPDQGQAAEGQQAMEAGDVEETAPAEDDAAAEPDDQSQGGTGALLNAEGQQVGNVSISALASGNSVVTVNAEGFPEGTYAMHVHQVGACDGPDFETAGDHIAGDHEHGVMAEAGPHPGDLANVTVQGDGILVADSFAIGLTHELVFDADGSAVIVHARPDDYVSQPGGDSGARIACAVIEPASATMTDETVDAGEQQPADELGTTDAEQQEQAIEEQPAEGQATEGQAGEGSGG